MPIRLTLSLLLVFSLGLAAPSPAAGIFNPYRVLLVIGDQWNDPASFLVEVPAAKGLSYDSSVRPKGTDFAQLVVMLKSWGVPFDIACLDQESLTINHFLDPDGKALYGCIIWAADPEADILSQNYSVLEEAVEKHGISLVALFDRIKTPEIEALLGIKYLGYNMTHDLIETAGDHYLTRGLGPQLGPTTPYGYAHRTRVEAEKDAQVLARQGKYPALTLRELTSGARAVWIGGDNLVMFEDQAWREILRRAITYSVGYSLFKTWENHCILVMDDPGGAQCAWLDHWHYPTLTREEIRARLIEPLKKHGAKLVINVIPGFVNEASRSIELSFQQKFTDQFGVVQDFISTKEGLDDGVREGVFEIQSHGWTHMQPDLDSPPGPWWGAPLDGEKAEVGWYREFQDTRRGFKEIPAATQLFHMKKGMGWVERLFGTTPLAFAPGGAAVSRSGADNTWVLAARAGFGWMSWLDGYLGQDMAVSGWLFQGTAEAPRTIPAQPDAHDKGIVEHPAEFLKTFVIAGPKAVYIGFNEYTAYLHTAWESKAAENPEVSLFYCAHYCRFFKEKESSWKLDVADWARESLVGKNIVVDGKSSVKVAKTGVQSIIIPAGVRWHTVAIK